MNYYIFDCYGQRVGNPKGYRTFTGASRREKQLRTILLDRFEKMQDHKPTNTLLSSIKREYH